MHSDLRFVSFEEQYGTPFLLGESVLRPDSRVLRVDWPGGGLVWNTPTRLSITHKDGVTFELPIVDVTRRGQIVAAVAGALAALLIWLLVRR